MNVKLLGYNAATEGGYDFIFYAPEYKGHKYTDGRIKLHHKSDEHCQKDDDEIKRELHAQAQGIYETWMQEIDKLTATKVHDTLKERGPTHGDYNVQSTMHDQLLAVMMKSPGFLKLRPQHRQALNIIAMKTSRILSGDAEHRDHWHDIAGYATLAENACSYRDPKQQEFDLQS